MHPVAHFAILGVMNIWIAEQYIFSCFREAQLVEMFVHRPFPYNIAFPVYFNNGVIQQTFVRNTLIVHIAVA